MEKNPGTGSGISILDHMLRLSNSTEFWVKTTLLEFFVTDRIRDPEALCPWNLNLKIRIRAINILDPQHTLTGTYLDNVGEGYFLDNVPALNIKEEEGRVAGLCQEDLRVVLVEPPGHRH
jgi:hypothetical protein